MQIFVFSESQNMFSLWITSDLKYPPERGSVTTLLIPLQPTQAEQCGAVPAARLLTQLKNKHNASAKKPHMLCRPTTIWYLSYPNVRLARETHQGKCAMSSASSISRKSVHIASERAFRQRGGGSTVSSKTMLAKLAHICLFVTVSTFSVSKLTE